MWASVAPLHFVEVADTGPDVSDDSYSASGRADIRIGHHVIDGVSGGILAHAYLPTSTTDGLAGDLHFDSPENWGQSNGGYFLETALHELGHSLGLDHELEVDAIMNPTLVGRFNALGEAFLLTDDIDGIRAIYGTGVGSVTPLTDDTPNDDPPMDDDPPVDDDPPEEEPIPGVTTSLDGDTGTLTITGDAAANSILITGNRWFTIVTGLDGTTVDDDSWSVHFGVDTIICNTGDGNDQVILFGVNSKSVDVELGENDDLLAILFSRMSQITGNGGGGSDSFFGFGNWGSTVSTSEFD